MEVASLSVFTEMHLQIRDSLFQFLEHLWRNILGVDSCARMVVRDQAPELQDGKDCFPEIEAQR